MALPGRKNNGDVGQCGGPLYLGLELGRAVDGRSGRLDRWYVSRLLGDYMTWPGGLILLFLAVESGGWRQCW